MKVSNQRIPLAERAGDAGAGMAAPAGRPRGVDPNQLEKALPEQGVSLRSLVARTRKQLACAQRRI